MMLVRRRTRSAWSLIPAVISTAVWAQSPKRTSVSAKAFSVCIGNVAGDVVEDIGLGEVIHLVGGTDGDGGGELAAAEAIEEKKPGHVPADRLGLKSRQRLKTAVDLGETRDAVGGQIQSFDSAQEVVVGIALPARADALVEAAPGLMILVGIQLVSL